MRRPALHRVKPPRPKRYKAEIKTDEKPAESPVKPPVSPYRSPRARKRPAPDGMERGRFIKLSAAAGILVALILIKVFDPQGAEDMRKSVDTYVGGDRTAVTVEALGRAISESGNIVEVFENLSDVISGRAQDTPVSNPEDIGQVPPAEQPDENEADAAVGSLEGDGEDDIDPDALHMEAIQGDAAPSQTIWQELTAPVRISEELVDSGAHGEDDTLPLPFGMQAPDTVDFTRYELSFKYTDPIAGIKSSGFGYRVHPILDQTMFHYGTDFAAAKNTKIGCFADGRVTAAGSSKTYGNYIMVSHGDGVSSFYAHCSKLYSKVGDIVKRGQKIAGVGDTGQVTGPHLHFELRRYESILNPEYYLGQ